MHLRVWGAMRLERVQQISCTASFCCQPLGMHSIICAPGILPLTWKSAGHMEGSRLAQKAACLELLYSIPHMLVLVVLHE